MKNEYKTEAHSEELEFIFKQDSGRFEEEMNRNSVILKDLRAYCRLAKKKISSVFAKKVVNNFTNILYLTLDCPPYTKKSSRLDSPLEYIDKIRRQYPENDIKVIIPIINLSHEEIKSSKISVEINEVPRVLEKTSIKFNLFVQNRIVEVSLYKFPKNQENVQVYGLCSSAFSCCKDISEIARLHYLAPFLKAVRVAVRKLEPDIVHSENIPFFLGEEFDRSFPHSIKVLQTVKDFTQIEMTKTEAFWALINLADKSAMKKLCRDKVIKKLVANLFNLHNAKRFSQMNECLRFIYKNYYKFRKYIDKGEDIEENIIFNKLNTRVLQIFPNLGCGDDLHYNSYLYTLKRVNYWTVVSETYYNEVFNNPNISGKMYPQIIKFKDKSDYVSYGLNIDKYGLNAPKELYYPFDAENFRDYRGKNKTAILKEFSADRIKTNFVDPTLFADEEAAIIGSLDSFYDSPLLFAYANADIFANGIDILFNTILKLFELHKTFQVIICIPGGLRVGFIKSWIEFLEKNKYIQGKWVFIDSRVNLSKFYASSDMTLIPRRANLSSPEHYLAMRYGCVPVAARSGILNDTISDIFDDISNGCGLKTKKGLLTEEDNNELFLAPVMKALNIYQHNPSSWNLLVKNCLLREFEWNFEILEKYNRIYKEILK